MSSITVSQAQINVVPVLSCPPSQPNVKSCPFNNPTIELDLRQASNDLILDTTIVSRYYMYAEASSPLCLSSPTWMDTLTRATTRGLLVSAASAARSSTHPRRFHR